MERVERERGVAGEPEPAVAAPPARPPAAANMFALQRAAGNHAIAQMLSAAPQAAIQRQLDEDFEHGGTPTKEEKQICGAFAKAVSAIVDQAHVELLAGRVGEWKGAKITTFLTLLRRGHPAALVHAGNAIEERVYGLMQEADLPCAWTPQFAESMGSASKPDIVVHVSDAHDALIDVTSARGHILGKAGGWTTSERYVYVAEAWFPSVLANHLPRIRKAVESGGLDAKQLRQMQAEVEAERKNRFEQRQRQVAEARALYNEYSSFAAFVREAWDGDRTAAAAWMRENGLGTLKAVPRKKGKRKPSAEAKAKMKRKANQVAYQHKKREAKRTAELERQHDVRAKQYTKNRTAVEEDEEPELDEEDEEEVVDEGALDDEAMLGLDDEDQEDEEEQELGGEDEEMAGTL